MRGHGIRPPLHRPGVQNAWVGCFHCKRRSQILAFIQTNSLSIFCIAQHFRCDIYQILPRNSSFDPDTPATCQACTRLSRRDPSRRKSSACRRTPIPSSGPGRKWLQFRSPTVTHATTRRTPSSPTRPPTSGRPCRPLRHNSPAAPHPQVSRLGTSAWMSSGLLTTRTSR